MMSGIESVPPSTGHGAVYKCAVFYQLSPVVDKSVQVQRVRKQDYKRNRRSLSVFRS